MCSHILISLTSSLFDHHDMLFHWQPLWLWCGSVQVGVLPRCCCPWTSLRVRLEHGQAAVHCWAAGRSPLLVNIRFISFGIVSGFTDTCCCFVESMAATVTSAAGSPQPRAAFSGVMLVMAAGLYVCISRIPLQLLDWLTRELNQRIIYGRRNI